MATLYELSEQMMCIEDALYENGGELTEEIEQALTETREGLVTKADGYNAVMRRMEMMGKSCADEIKRLQALKKTAENGVKTIKRHILDTMDAFGMERLEGSTCKFIPKNNAESLEVNEDVLISGYERNIEEFQQTLPQWLTIEVKVNKTVLKNQIKADGITPEGCEMVRTRSLMVK